MLFDFNDKVRSFHQGIHPCTLLTQKQSSKHPAEATTISGGERTQSNTDMTQEFQFRQHLALLTLERLLNAGYPFSFVLDRRLKVYQALSSVF